MEPGRPHETFDLKITVGPLLACRLSTAVAWNWLPRQRIAYRPRPATYAALVAVIALAPLEPLPAAIVFAGLLAALAAEFFALRRVVLRAVRATTHRADDRKR